MANVSFDEDQPYVRPNFVRTSRKGLTGLVKKMGWTKDDAKAEKILLLIAAIALLAAISIPFLLSGVNENPPVPKAKIDAALTIPKSFR